MTDRTQIGRTMQEKYEARWRQGDPWDSGNPADAEFVRAKFARFLELLGGRRVGRALEIGCGNGAFTALLAGVADSVLALDIAASAVARATAAVAGRGDVEFRVANVLEFDPIAAGPFDLVVLVETVYSLGWLYPLFDIAWLADQLAASLRPGGRLLLANTYGGEQDYLLRPYLIDTYRDLFRNVGLRVAAEEVFGRDRAGHLPVLVTLFAK